MSSYNTDEKKAVSSSSSNSNSTRSTNEGGSDVESGHIDDRASSLPADVVKPKKTSAGYGSISESSSRAEGQGGGEVHSSRRARARTGSATLVELTDAWEHEVEDGMPPSNLEIAWGIIVASYPIAFSLVFEILGNFVALFYASRVTGSIAPYIIFAGISLGNMYANVSCLSILEGASSAVETLGSQSNGAEEWENVGLILLRCIAVLAVLTIPLLPTWYFVGDVLGYIGVERGVCEVVAGYLEVRILAVPFEIVDISYNKYLVAIGTMEPSLYSSILFNVIMTMLGYVFIIHYELSYVYIGWAYVIACASRCFLVFAFSYSLPEVQRTLCRPSMRVFNDWKEFLSLGLPGCVMLCAEWWAFEILTAFAGLLSAAAVDAQSIILQINVLVFMFPFGVAMATASLVGNALGSGDIALAKRIGVVSMSTVLVANVILSILLLNFGKYCIEILTEDREVIDVTVQLLPFLAVFMLFDGQQGVVCGVLRGVGKQDVGAYFGLVGYYGIGIPAAWYLAFHAHLGVSGLMIGMSASTLFLCVALYWYVLYNDSNLYVPLKSSAAHTTKH